MKTRVSGIDGQNGKYFIIRAIVDGVAVDNG